MGCVSLFSTEESFDQVNYFSKRIFSLIAFVKEELDTDVVEGNKAGSIFWSLNLLGLSKREADLLEQDVMFDINFRLLWNCCGMTELQNYFICDTRLIQ